MGFYCKGDVLRQNNYVSGGIIKIGDAVTQNSAGQVVVAAAGDRLLGVSNAYNTAAGQQAKVLDHPDQQFVGPASTAGITALTDLNLNYNIVANTNGTNPESAHTIDGTSGATTATLPLKVLNLDTRLKNPGFAAIGGLFVFVINNHILKGSTGTVGI